MEKKVKFHSACHIFHTRCCLGYIQTIRSMEESVQHVVMAAIQHLLTNCTPATPVTSSREVEELQEEVFTLLEIDRNSVHNKFKIMSQCLIPNFLSFYYY